MVEEAKLWDFNPGWLESVTIGGFRVWHIIAICLAIVMSIIIMVCCCVRFRIPRTKQEIEADYQRKQITKKFREKLQQIKNSEMDDMDLQKDADRYKYGPADYNSPSYLPGVHIAWQSRRESIVSYNSGDSGYDMAYAQLSTNKIVFHQYIPKMVDVEDHVVYPARQGSQSMIRNSPIAIHNSNNNSNYLSTKYNNNNDKTRYHYIYQQYAAAKDNVVKSTKTEEN